MFYVLPPRVLPCCGYRFCTISVKRSAEVIHFDVPTHVFVELQFHFQADFDKLYIIRKLTFHSKQIYKHILSVSSDFDSPASYNFNFCKYHTVLEFQNLDLRLTCSYLIPICSVYIWSSVLKITSCLGEQNSVYDRKKLFKKTKVIKE